MFYLSFIEFECLFSFFASLRQEYWTYTCARDDWTQEKLNEITKACCEEVKLTCKVEAKSGQGKFICVDPNQTGFSMTNGEHMEMCCFERHKYWAKYQEVVMKKDEFPEDCK